MRVNTRHPNDQVEQYAHHLTLSPTTLPLLSELEQAHAQKWVLAPTQTSLAVFIFTCVKLV